MTTIRSNYYQCTDQCQLIEAALRNTIIYILEAEKGTRNSLTVYGYFNQKPLRHALRPDAPRKKLAALVVALCCYLIKHEDGLGDFAHRLGIELTMAIKAKGYDLNEQRTHRHNDDNLIKNHR